MLYTGGLPEAEAAARRRRGTLPAQQFNENHDDQGRFAGGGYRTPDRATGGRGENAPTGRSATRRLSHGLSFNDLDGIAHENGGHHLKSTRSADTFIFGSDHDARGFLQDTARAGEWDSKGIDPEMFMNYREAGQRVVITVGK